MIRNIKPPLKKSSTFHLTRSESMASQLPTGQLHQLRTVTQFVPNNKNSPLMMEFPNSSQLIFGEEILHFGHPQHPLYQVNLPDLFTCAGCKEFGAGRRFVCQQCEFQLHYFCALAPPALKSHPFHFQHQLVLYSKPGKGGMSQSKCDVCHKPTKGYAYRCSACNFQMHPCCAMLSTEINLEAHPHTLRLVPATSTSWSSSGGSEGGSGSGFLCGECRRKRSGRAYHCTVCDYHLHAVCAKNMKNGLQENGINLGREKPSGLGIAARVASQVVSDFFGGLLEQLGETVAEVLVDDVTRSGRPNARNNHP